MKKNYVLNKQVVLALLFLFTVHLTSYAQTKIKSTQIARKTQVKNVSNVFQARAAGIPAEIVTSCGPYTWPTNGVTYSASGTYTSNGTTQGYNTQAAYLNNVTAQNSTIATNSLGGLAATNPINLAVGPTAVSISANPGVTYTSSTFVSVGTATSSLIINLSPGVYGFGANIFATDAADLLITGDITVTYSTGFVDTRTVSSASEFFGYTSTTPITSVTLTCANTVAPFKWPTINNLSLATSPSATLDLTVTTSPVTGNYSICQGLPVTGGLTSDLGGGTAPTPLPNYSGDTAGGPIFNRPQVMNQGGVCLNSGVGTAVPYREHTFTAPTNGVYTFSNCGASTFDSFLALYQAPFNPTGLCAGNTLVASSDDVCGAQSTVTATLVGGTSYTLVVTGYGNTDTGTYTVTSTTPTTPVPGVEWYTASTGGTAIGTGSPFNPIGVAGSGLTNTNTPGTTPFYAQFPGETCRTIANFTVTPSTTPTFTAVAPICIGETLTALPTTSNNGVTGTWSPALDATTTTTYTFTPDAGQCGTTTTLTITVNPLPTITCPGNITACEGDTVNFTVTSNVSTGPVTLSQNTSSVAAAGAGLGCNPGGDNAFYRVYDLTALGYTSNLTLNNIKFSVQSSAVDRPVTVSAYTLTGALTNANLTLLGSTTVTATTSTSIIDYTAAMGGLTVPGGSTLVISYAVTSSTNNTFIPGANAAGQSAPVFIKAVDCGIAQPTSFTAVGFPNVHVILDAELTQAGSLVQTAGLPSGSVFPVGTTTVTYLATTASGCEASCSFDVVVNAPAPPTFTQVAPICVGGTIAALPTTSNNGVTGTWSPAIDATVTTTYTFTPDAGQCAVPTTMTIAVNPLPTVAFTANPFPVCAGSNTILTANVTNATPTVTFGTQSVSMTTAAFGVPVTSPLAGVLELAPSNGCAPFAAGLFAGKIALIQRGTCAFAVKAQNAQDAGAIGVILYNNVAGAIIPGGTAPGVTIPVYGMTLADGQALIAAMTANQVNVTLNPAPPVTYLWGNGDTTQSTDTGVLNADTDFTVTVTNTVTGCSSTVTVTVPVTPLTVPTFNQVADICSGGTLDPLPTSSLEGLAGTWSPALDNTTTTTYTFTPTPIAGQCLGTATMTITVNQPTVPVFTQVAPICVGGTTTLPTTSNNGFTGTWAPAIDNTVTTTYTFTPDAGQCVDSTVVTMTIVVNPLPTVAFTANPFPVCAGSNTILTANVTNATPTVTFGTQSVSMTTAAFGVPVTSPLSGTLALAPSNGCAPFAAGLFAGKIALIQRGTCAFAVKAQNAQDAGAIGVILYNNVAGAIIPGGTAPGVTIPVYGMTLADGQALIAAMTANEVDVTLNPAPPVTYLWGNGDTTQSTDTGVLNADTDFTVTVTNTVTGCSATITVTVPVTPLTVPTFNQVADICTGGTLDPLPTSSLEGLTGTWSPALDNTTTTTYTFTPDTVAGQCLGTTTMTITVNSAAEPTGDSVQTITAPNTADATLEDLVVSPTNVIWYGSLADAQAGTNALPNTTVLTNGSTYYAVNVVGACSSTPFAVTVTVTLGNDQFDDINFTYSPNPTSSILNISYSHMISEVSVTNLLGQKIMTKKTNSTEVQIDLSGLAEATYFVKVISEGKEKVVKVIKKD